MTEDHQGDAESRCREPGRGVQGAARWVLLHGFMGSGESWDGVISCLPAGWETVTPRLLGHGAPSRTRLAADFESGAFAREVDRLAAGIAAMSPPVHLAGYSMGGRLALGLLCQRQELWRVGPLRSVVLVGAHPGLESAQARSEREAADRRWMKRFARASGSQARFEAVLAEWRSQPVLAGLERRVAEAVLERDAQIRHAHQPAALASAMGALSLSGMPSYWSMLRDLTLPVQLVVGALDEKFTRLAERMLLELPRAELVAVPAAGHNLLLEAPEALANCLVRIARATREREAVDHE